MVIPQMFDEALNVAREEIAKNRLVKKAIKNITGKNKLLCFLGFHEEEDCSEVVYKDEFTETSNILTYCNRCGKIIDYSVSTTLGPITIK